VPLSVRAIKPTKMAKITKLGTRTNTIPHLSVNIRSKVRFRSGLSDRVAGVSYAPLSSAALVIITIIVKTDCSTVQSLSVIIFLRRRLARPVDLVISRSIRKSVHPAGTRSLRALLLIIIIIF